MTSTIVVSALVLVPLVLLLLDLARPHDGYRQPTAGRADQSTTTRSRGTHTNH